MHRLIIFTIFLSFTLLACTSQNTPQDDDSSGVTVAQVANYAQLANAETLAQGQLIYEQNCASCHGLDGEGQFPDAPMQPDATGRIGAPPHDSTGHTWHHDDDLLFDIVQNGGNGAPERFYPMPAFGDTLTDEDIWSVLAYIKSFWTQDERMIQAERTLIIRQQN